MNMGRISKVFLIFYTAIIEKSWIHKCQWFAIFIFLFFPNYSFSESIENQLKTMELEYGKKGEALEDIEKNVYGTFIKNAMVKVSEPIIVSINGDLANIRILVSFIVDSPSMRTMEYIGFSKDTKRNFKK